MPESSLPVEIPRPDVNRLCHYVALSKMGATHYVMEQLVAACVATSPQSMTSPLELRDMLKEYYHINFPIARVDDAITKLMDQGLLEITVGKSYRIKDEAIADILRRIEAWQYLNRSVKSEWRIKVEKLVGKLDDSEFNDMWGFLEKVLEDAFVRHGVQTLSLIAPDQIIDKHILGFERLLKSQKDILKKYGEELLRACVSAFFSDDSEARNQYLSWNLSSTFSYYALSYDGETSKYLGSTFEHLDIFLDTNFIFGILGLHENPWNCICRELIHLVKEHRIPITFYYHEETYHELRNWIEEQSELFKLKPFSMALSRAAANISTLPLLFRKYHEENAVRPLDPSAFLERFNNLQELLAKEGFIIFREPKEYEERLITSGEREGSYYEFLQTRRLWKPREYSAIKHDMRVISAVSRRTRPSDSPLGVGAYLLTVDRHLNAFVRDVLTKKHVRPATIFPGQLLQLIYPLLDITEGYETCLSYAFSIPMFRSINIDKGRAQQLILNQLRAFEEIGEEQATACLTNELLIANVSKATDEESVIRAIDEAFALQNKSLREEGLKLREEIDLKAKDVQKYRDDVDRLSMLVSKQSDDIKNLGDRLKGSYQDIDSIKKENANLKEDNIRRKRKRTIFIKIIPNLGILAMIGYLWFNIRREVGWLRIHSNRDSLLIFISIGLIITAVIIDLWKMKKVRIWLLSVLGIDIIFGIISSLGRLPF
jgi:hypothetical protein